MSSTLGFEKMGFHKLNNSVSNDDFLRWIYFQDYQDVYFFYTQKLSVTYRLAKVKHCSPIIFMFPSDNPKDNIKLIKIQIFHFFGLSTSIVSNKFTPIDFLSPFMISSKSRDLSLKRKRLPLSFNP